MVFWALWYGVVWPLNRVNNFRGFVHLRARWELRKFNYYSWLLFGVSQCVVQRSREDLRVYLGSRMDFNLFGERFRWKSFSVTLRRRDIFAYIVHLPNWSTLGAQQFEPIKHLRHRNYEIKSNFLHRPCTNQINNQAYCKLLSEHVRTDKQCTRPFNNRSTYTRMYNTSWG